MKNFISLVILVITLFGPGLSLYFFQDFEHGNIMFLGVFIICVIIHMVASRKLGWKIDKEIKKQHSW
jgi:hypothetical protein